MRRLLAALIVLSLGAAMPALARGHGHGHGHGHSHGGKHGAGARQNFFLREYEQSR